MLSQYRPSTWEVSGNIGYLVNRSHYPEVHTRTTGGGSSWSSTLMIEKLMVRELCRDKYHSTTLNRTSNITRYKIYCQWFG